MNAERFKGMTHEAAQQLLAEFLEDGRANIDIVMAHASHAGVDCDYSIDSLPAFLRWAFSEMRVVPKDEDPSVPEFIRSTDGYKKGLFDFDDRSKNLICFTAYYWGECFVRTYPTLKWSTGNSDFYQANMPIVAGFMHERELPPMLVISNLFRRVIKKPDRIEDIDKAASTWVKDIG